MTAIAEKMISNGIQPRDVKLTCAIAEFMNNGGSELRAIGLVKDAYERARQGHLTIAKKVRNGLPTPRAKNDSGNGHVEVADKAKALAPASLSPNDDAEGHAPAANKATATVPTASSTNGSEGQDKPADKARNTLPPASGRAAVMRAATQQARSFLDSFKLRDGRSIGSIAFCELESLRFENAREAAVIRQIQKHYANAPGDALVRDLIREDDMNRFIQKAAEVAEF